MARLLIFDVDGVLEREERVDSARKDALMVCVSKKFCITNEEAKALWEQTRKKLPYSRKYTSVYLFMKLGFTRKRFFDVMNSVDPKGLISQHKDAAKMLRILSRDNTIATFSNTPMKASIRTLKVINVYKYIDKVFCADSFDVSKPSIMALKKILRSMRAKPKDSFFIGNSLMKDIVPAHKIGMKTILYDPSKKHKRRPKEADFMLRELMGIVRII